MPVKYTSKATGKSVVVSPKAPPVRPSVYEEATGKKLVILVNSSKKS